MCLVAWTFRTRLKFSNRTDNLWQCWTSPKPRKQWQSRNPHPSSVFLFEKWLTTKNHSSHMTGKSGYPLFPMTPYNLQMTPLFTCDKAKCRAFFLCLNLWTRLDTDPLTPHYLSHEWLTEIRHLSPLHIYKWCNQQGPSKISRWLIQLSNQKTNSPNKNRQKT